MKTILIVDDSRIMRNVIKNTLTTLGIPCQFMEAGNGAKACEILATNKIDLVFLDWNMPEMNGMEFLAKARAMPAYKDTPIIMVTSEAAKYNVVEALANGATEYILKPVSEKVFLQKLALIQF